MGMELEHRPCPICGQFSDKLVVDQKIDAAALDAFAFASRKYPEYMHLRLVKCADCSLVYADPAPSVASLRHEYQQAAFDSSTEAWFAAKTYAHYLPRDLKIESALDIGCGGGEFLVMLRQRGVTHLQGVEPSPEAANTAPETIRNRIHTAFFAAEDFAPESFDLVSSFQTLEHVSDPLKLVQGAYKLLKPGGRFYSVSHNIEGALNKMLGTRSPIFDIEHLQLFSPVSLRKCIERAGFTDVRVFPIWNSYPIGYWIKLFPMPMLLKKKLIQALRHLKLDALKLSAPVGNMGVIATKVG